MSEEEPTCQCPDPALCIKLKRHMNGRLWEIWNDINISKEQSELYRRLWERQAGLESAPEPKKGCGCRGT